VELSQLSHLLSKAVGDERASEIVRARCAQLGLRGERGLSVDEALSVLESVAQEPGVLGVTARFAKSRLHLSLVG